MKKRYVLSNKNLPTKMPLFQTLVTFLALDYWNAHSYLVGAMIMLFALIWVGFFVSLYRDERVDLNDEDSPVKSKKQFSERLEELLKKQKAN